jgi:hypothetical protein
MFIKWRIHYWRLEKRCLFIYLGYVTAFRPPEKSGLWDKLLDANQSMDIDYSSLDV